MPDTLPTYRILIVDDTPQNIKVAANILQHEQYKLFFATTGSDALATVRQTGFDLILLDVMMPDMDGFQVCRRLKEAPETRDIPVIFLTAKTDSASVVNGFDLGAVDYVTKPLNGKELLARVKTHLALRDAQQRLKAVNASKDTFFSILAHDLRSPFTSLLGITEVLDEQFDMYSADELRLGIGRIRQAAARLFALLENLLTWSRLQRGLIGCVPQNVLLPLLVEQIVALFRPGAEHKQIDLRNGIPNDAVCYADIHMVDTILRNLISNAVKFTGAGGIIEISAARCADAIAIAVKDTGTGISAEGLAHLFRIDGKYTRPGTADERGTGLGLLLCHEFALLNHGTLRVESTPGVGSVFTLTLPRELTIDN